MKSDPIIVSFSELDTARQCPLKHQLAYRERWTKPHDTDSPLTKGTAWHAALELHYRVIQADQRDADTRTDPGVLLALCASKVKEFLSGQPDDIADLVWWMYDGYISQYGIDEQWQIVAVEHPAVCRLHTPAGRPSRFALKMRIDLVVRDRSAKPKLWIVDHKSCKNLPKDKEFDLDDQFGLYTWGLRQLGKKVFGQIHDAARTQRNQGDFPEVIEEIKAKNLDPKRKKPLIVPEPQPLADRFRRHMMDRSDKELDVIAFEAYQTAHARYNQQREVEAARRRGLQVESPRHTDSDRCRWRCDFLEPCLASRRGIELRPYLADKGFRRETERH